MDSRFRGNDGRGVACGCVWAEERKARSERRGAKGEERKARSERRGAKGEERKARSERRGAKGEERKARAERRAKSEASFSMQTHSSLVSGPSALTLVNRCPAAADCCACIPGTR